MEQKTIDKIKSLFKSSNFVTSYDVKIKGVTKKQFKQFTDHFGLTPKYWTSHGALCLEKNGEILDSKQIKNL